MMFIIIRDGTGYLQCFLSKELVLSISNLQCHVYDALTLTTESTVTLYGIIEALPEGKSAPDNHELRVDYWEVVAKAPAGDDSFSNQLNAVFSLLFIQGI